MARRHAYVSPRIPTHSHELIDQSGIATLYGLTKRLSHVLSLPLTLHHTLAPSLNRIKKRDPESHKFDNVPPELALSAAAVIVLKMVYGLDGRPRYCRMEFSC